MATTNYASALDSLAPTLGILSSAALPTDTLLAKIVPDSEFAVTVETFPAAIRRIRANIRKAKRQNAKTETVDVASMFAATAIR